MPERVDELFTEYAAAYARGERPHAHEFLARAGGQANELASLIDAFVARAPAPAADDLAVALYEAWREGESPLLRLRTARGVTRDAVVAALVGNLALDVQKREKVQRYYDELECGSLVPERVDHRVWSVLAEALGARVGDLLGWRLRGPEVPARAFASASQPMMAAMRTPEPSHEPEDEIDRLFRSG